MTAPLPQLHPNRASDTEKTKLVNQLRFYSYQPPGTQWSIAEEILPAFSCVARNTATGNILLARADGTNYAVGVIGAAALVGELAQVVFKGIVKGAVSGRTAGDLVWVGTAGTLVFSPPASPNYDLVIAVCVNATDIYVDAEGGPGSLAVQQSFQFIVKSAAAAASGLMVDPHWLAPAQTDGEDDIDAIDERGWPYCPSRPGTAYDFCVKVLDGDGRVVDVGVWQWVFTLLKNTSTSVASVTITSGGVGTQTAISHGALSISAGDHLGVRVAGSQVSGISTVGTLYAFVTVTVRG